MMRTNHRHHHQRGQALVEAVISLPLLILVAFGVFDIGTMVDTQTIVRGEARAGLTEALASANYVNNPIGTAIRSETNNIGVADNVWGNGNAGGAYDCGVASTNCGDPGGCAVGDSWWSATVSACFSVGSIHPSTPGACGTTPSSWGIPPPRPAIGAGDCLFVKVVVAVKPATPVVNVLTTNGVFYISDTETGVQLY